MTSSTLTLAVACRRAHGPKLSEPVCLLQRRVTTLQSPLAVIYFKKSRWNQGQETPHWPSTLSAQCIWHCPTCYWAGRAPPLVGKLANAPLLYIFPSDPRGATGGHQQAAGGEKCIPCRCRSVCSTEMPSRFPSSWSKKRRRSPLRPVEASGRTTTDFFPLLLTSRGSASWRPSAFSSSGPRTARWRGWSLAARWAVDTSTRAPLGSRAVGKTVGVPEEIHVDVATSQCVSAKRIREEVQPAGWPR